MSTPKANRDTIKKVLKRKQTFKLLNKENTAEKHFGIRYMMIVAQYLNINCFKMPGSAYIKI